MGDIAVLIADSQLLFADALTIALSGSPGLRIVGDQPVSADEARSAIEAHHPAVALIGYWLGEVQGTVVTRAIAGTSPATKVIHLTNWHKRSQVQQALGAGAIGVLPKNLMTVDGVARGVRRAYAGEFPVLGSLTEDTTEGLVRVGNDPRARSSGISDLTRRELQVLELIGSGLSVQDIAATVAIAHSTVRKHIHHILAKTNARSQVQAAAVAREHGLIP